MVYDDTDSNGNPAAGLPVGGAMAYLDTNGNGVRDAGEPTAVTDANGAYTFPDLPAGTYTVRVDMTTVGRGTPGAAYVVPAGTPGTEAGANAGNYTYGMAFTTERPVVVTSLGVFDDNSDGLTTTLTAVLYDADHEGRAGPADLHPGQPRHPGRRHPLPRPAQARSSCRPGFQGMIVAYGFGATTDRAGNAPT